MRITGAELFVKALKKEGVEKLFAYPGGQVIDLFDALYDEREIEVILPRHEQGLVHAADGYARSTGRVGVCLVTSGPGAANLVTGIATANSDSVPLVCFTGQVPSGLMGKESFQEVNTVEIMKSICKYAVTVKKREELGTIIKKAFCLAKAGRPGAVVVDFPKDIQRASGSDYYPEQTEIVGIKTDYPADSEKISKSLSILNNAQKPLFLVGGGVNIAQAGKEMTRLAELTGVPVVTTIMGKGAIPTGNELYIGNLGIHGCCAANFAVSNCDVLFSIGTRFNDRIMGRIEEFAKNAVIIHIDIDSEITSKNVLPTVSVTADAKKAVSMLLQKAEPCNIEEWRNKLISLKKQFPIRMEDIGLTPQKIIQSLNENFKEAVFVADVGQNQMWTTQFLALNENRHLLTSGGLGTMGYALPAAIGAQIGNPNKDVVAVSGDGGIQMNIQELATAVAYELPIIICIFNNGYLGNVRQWQEMFYNKRYSHTCLRFRKSCEENCKGNGESCPEYIPDFTALAKSFGAEGIRVTDEKDVKEALIFAKNNKKTPTLIEFIINSEINVMPIVPPGKPLSKMIMQNKKTV